MAKAQALDGADLVPADGVRNGTPQRAVRRRIASDDLVPMQFRMPPEFVEAFKIRAARRRMKLNELLQAVFAESSNMSVKGS